MINNNQWAISTPLKKQGELSPIEKAKGLGLNTLDVNGYDLNKVRTAVSTAVKHIRDKQGPYVVQATTYRYCDHTTADNATRYQDTREREAFKDNNSRLIFEQALLKEKKITPKTIQTHLNQAEHNLNQIVQQFQLIS